MLRHIGDIGRQQIIDNEEPPRRGRQQSAH
jgi:hypothetical protein